MSAQNVPSGEKQGETAVFVHQKNSIVQFDTPLTVTQSKEQQDLLRVAAHSGTFTTLETRGNWVELTFSKICGTCY